MNTAQAHRGPDGEGLWASSDGAVVLGHRRLAILDLTPAANQPLSSADGRFRITYNGELYNFAELKNELQTLGSRFATRSDTEVVIEAYRRWGAECFRRFRGMWALCLVDLVENKAVFSRDPFGIKPLYFGYLGGALYFASEPKALLAADDAFREPDAVTERLFLDHAIVDRGEWTFFSRVRRFPHAHYAEIPLDDVSAPFVPVRYWAPPRETLSISFEDAVREMRRLFERSVELHLVSDVPVGTCLSGGLDSSAIASVAGTLLKNPAAFHTFTSRYPDLPDIDEMRWAEAVIEAGGFQSRCAYPTEKLFRESFPAVAYHQDEPFGSTSVFAQYLLFREVRRAKVKVVLDGQGADELLAGYHGFFPAFLSALFAEREFPSYLREGVALRRRHGFDFKRQIARDLRDAVRGRRPLSCAAVDEMEARLAALAPPEGGFEQTLTHLTCEANLPQLLRYEDRNSMAHSVEARVPFLEPELVSFALALPARYKVRFGATKAVFREAVKGWVPEAVRTRRSKLGFATPEKAWLENAFGIRTGEAGGRPWRELSVARWRDRFGPRTPPRNGRDSQGISRVKHGNEVRV